MAEEFQDPRELTYHPRRRHSLLGHQAAEQRLLRAAQSGKLHHAWLLSGPEGIGKATLAYRFARFLLARPAVDAPDLAVSPDHAAARLIAAGAHPDLLVVERAVDPRAKRLKSEISVDNAREASSFFGRTAGAGGWRLCIVDEAGDLNKESANALLKIIEEPPERAVFLIVCHRVGALLPTIRSRCMHLPLKPLSEADTRRVLDEIDPGGAAAHGAAAALAAGSPGRALRLSDSKGAKAFETFRKLPRLSLVSALEIGAQFSHRDRAEDLAVFGELLTAWIAAEARRRGLAGGGAKLAKTHGDIVASLRKADALNLDRRQTAVDALLLLDEALKAP
jgi:DNA polymerase-3 subunit delta'